MLQALCSENLIFNKDLFAERSGTEGELGNEMAEIVKRRRKFSVIFINHKSLTILKKVIIRLRIRKKSYNGKLI